MSVLESKARCVGKRSLIVAREKEHDFMISAPGDFDLDPGVEFDAREILGNPSLTLYCLDLDRREACFVETPKALDLAAAPFYFVAQFLNATHLVSVSFETFHELASEIEADDDRIAFIYSVGRCGSTLVSKAFEAVPTVCSLSEPDTLTQLVTFRGEKRMSDVELEKMARDCIRFTCKPLANEERAEFWVIKFRSQCLEICDLLTRAFPRARRLYLTREPISWLESVYRAFVMHDKVNEEETIQWYEDIFAGMYTLVREQKIFGEPMPIWKSWMLNWVANEENKKQLESSGIRFCEASFEEIKEDPETVMERLFVACGLGAVDWVAIRPVLARDSQEGSTIARSEINDASKLLPDRNRDEAIELLIERGHLTR